MLKIISIKALAIKYLLTSFLPALVVPLYPETSYKILKNLLSHDPVSGFQLEAEENPLTVPSIPLLLPEFTILNDEIESILSANNIEVTGDPVAAPAKIVTVIVVAPAPSAAC